jgi:DnaJ-class molecular chaperone with C-terminal Zn finger domain
MREKYYERLGVPPDASTDEIAAAYRKQLKETHPDVSDASDASERTKRLIEAKNVLTDETERARYDRLGHDRYVGVKKGTDPAESSTDGHRGSESRERSRTSGGGQTASEESTDNTATGRGDSAARGSVGVGGRESHTTRQGRGRHRNGIDWEEWAETDWEEVSEAVWQEVTGDDSGGSRHGTAGTGDGSSSSDTGAAGTPGRSGGDGATESGVDQTGSARKSGVDQTGSARKSGVDTSRGGERTVGSTASRTADGGAAGAGGNGGPTTAGAASKRATPGEVGSSVGTADRGDWAVGWYSDGDPSGTSHDAHSYGSSDTDDRLWDSWSPGTNRDNRYSRSSYPPVRVLSPIQSVVLFCLCFVTYPLLVTGTVFEFFNQPTRLVLAIFLVLVVATLIILSQIGVVVFAGWTLLFPVVFANYGVSVFTQASLFTMSAVLVSLGLAMLSWLLIRPPTL